MIKQYPRVILALIWLLGAIVDRLWLSLDSTVPAWDQSEYLNGAIRYYQALQSPLWFSLDWWRELWLLSPKVPPFTYLMATPVLNIWGTSVEAATILMLFCSAILIYCVYILGKLLFSPGVGLLGAIICLLLPGLYIYRLEFLLDYPLTMIVTLSFTVLTVWREKQTYLWMIIWGVSFGLAMLTKQPALFFLLIPYLWLVGSSIKQRKWSALLQLLLGWGIGMAVLFPWYRTNWLLMLTSGKRATIDSAIAEGDPPLNTLAAWTFYLEISPYLLSWVLIVVPLLGLIIYGWRNRTLKKNNLVWLLVFLVGGYLLSSVNLNKDARYILPLLPVLSILLAVGLLSWKGRWGYQVRVATISVSIVLMLAHLFPLGLSPLRHALTPGRDNFPYQGAQWPHNEVIATINQTSPYLHSTLGVLPSTPEINQHNFSFYGAQLEFPVSGRQVGVRKAEVVSDANSLDWFVTKTKGQGSVPPAQGMIVELVENEPNFSLEKAWQLPDQSILHLYHREPPSLRVTPTTTTAEIVTLDAVSIPESFPPGIPIPVTYEWSGSDQQLKQGIVLLTWVNIDPNQGDSFWIHDHGLGMGRLNWGNSSGDFTVIERTATFPPAELIPGDYRLEAIYLNRDTNQTYSISVPDIIVTVDPNAQSTIAPELDLPTQLRLAAPDLAKGIDGLEPIFALTARINQYDPRLDYLSQLEKSLEYRLSTTDSLDWTYALALANVLQQDVTQARLAVQRLIKLDPDNPYHHAYLAFIYLYDWNPTPAAVAINQAIALNPDVPEFTILRGLTYLFRGRFFLAWQDLKSLVSNGE
ncbi:MAG: phospholipid carrier-dependent glycosyltransferase [Gloeocapsa sp. DLM2.Bin57]|nr:MAG: phospholipid carrier-dependent glycosyltransferase [Gloeocapsa sp. DLM2.Bin57]